MNPSTRIQKDYLQKFDCILTDIYSQDYFGIPTIGISDYLDEDVINKLVDYYHTKLNAGARVWTDEHSRESKYDLDDWRFVEALFTFFNRMFKWVFRQFTNLSVKLGFNYFSLFSIIIAVEVASLSNGGEE